MKAILKLNVSETRRITSIAHIKILKYISLYNLHLSSFYSTSTAHVLYINLTSGFIQVILYTGLGQRIHAGEPHTNTFPRHWHSGTEVYGKHMNLFTDELRFFLSIRSNGNGHSRWQMNASILDVWNVSWSGNALYVFILANPCIFIERIVLFFI